MIELKDLHKSFGDKEVLKGINAQFEDGKTNLIIGQSGSGKSTLRNTIPVSGCAGRSVISTRWPLCRPMPTARVRVLMVRC